MRQYPDQIGLSRDLQSTELALDRKDRNHVTGSSSRATWAEAKTAFCGTPSSIRRVILRVPGGSMSRGGEFRPQTVEIVDPVELVPGETTARGLVEHFDFSVLVDRQQRARRIVDDRRQVARLGELAVCRA